MKRYVELVECETDKVLDRVDVTFKTERQAERVYDAVTACVDAERFYAAVYRDLLHARRSVLLKKPDDSSVEPRWPI